jgi:hypothetical protein
MTGDRGERATGTPNTIYDLSSVLYHSLEGGASYERYIRDAKEVGDRELADFFARVRDEDGRRADEAQLLLAARTTGGAAARPESLEAAAPSAEPAWAPPRGAEEAPPRTSGVGLEEGALPPTEEAPPPRTEGARPMEGAASAGDASPGTEETAPRGREGASSSGQPEREREEDRGLLDRAKDALMGEGEPGRRDDPGRRR